MQWIFHGSHCGPYDRYELTRLRKSMKNKIIHQIIEERNSHCCRGVSRLPELKLYIIMHFHILPSGGKTREWILMDPSSFVQFNNAKITAIKTLQSVVYFDRSTTTRINFLSSEFLGSIFIGLMDHYAYKAVENLKRVDDWLSQK